MFIVYVNNKPCKLVNNKQLETQKTIKTSTVFDDNFKSIFEGMNIKDISYKYVVIDSVQAELLKGKHIQYNKLF
jgi:hypothetical protein